MTKRPNDDGSIPVAEVGHNSSSARHKGRSRKNRLRHVDCVGRGGRHNCEKIHVPKRNNSGRFQLLGFRPFRISHMLRHMLTSARSWTLSSLVFADWPAMVHSTASSRTKPVLLVDEGPRKDEANRGRHTSTSSLGTFDVRNLRNLEKKNSRLLNRFT